MDIFNSSLSGLNAASVRLSNSANNVANQLTVGAIDPQKGGTAAFVPKNVTQSAIEPSGGVQAGLTVRDPATVPLYDPENPSADADGLVAAPNVDSAEEVVQQKMASYNFKGNLKVLETYNEMLGQIVDIAA